MADPEENPVELDIPLEKVCFIVLKAREYDAKVEPAASESGAKSEDDESGDVLEDFADDPTGDELRAAIDGLNDDEVIDLIALAWVGRGDFSGKEWREARKLAEERHRPRSAAYLMEMPMLGDYIEEGLEELGYSCADFEADRL